MGAAPEEGCHISAESAAGVEAYLDQVLAPLTRQLAPFHRQELWRELGQSEDAAVSVSRLRLDVVPKIGSEKHGRTANWQEALDCL